jgi:hypothetical protein
MEQISHRSAGVIRLPATGMEFTLKMLITAMQFTEISILENEIRWALERAPHDRALPGHRMSRFEILKRVLGESWVRRT